MKRLILIIMGVLLCTSLYADMNTYIAGSGTVAAGGTISYESTQSTTDATGTTITITKPTSTTSGDGLYAFIIDDADQLCSTPSGWTLIGYISSSSSRQTAFFKEAGGSEGASYTFTVAGSSSKSGCIMRFSKTSGSWDTSFDENTDYSTAAISRNATLASSNVTCVDGSYLILGEGNDDNTIISSAPEDMTQAAACDGASLELYAYYESRSAGVVSKSITWDSGDVDLTAIAVVVRLQ